MLHFGKSIYSNPWGLAPKGLMVFFEFWSGSHFLDLQPNLLTFLELGCLFEIYLDM